MAGIAEGLTIKREESSSGSRGGRAQIGMCEI